MGKTMQQIGTIVMAYPAHQKRPWLQNPNGNTGAAITPVLTAMVAAEFDALFVDFTRYIQVDNALGNVVMSKDELKQCNTWADLSGYVFALQ